MNTEEKLVQGLKLIVEAFAEMVSKNQSVQTSQIKQNLSIGTTDITYNMKEAQEYLGVSHWAIYELVRRGKIKHFKCGRKYLLRKSALDEWIKQELENSIKNENNEKFEI